MLSTIEKSEIVILELDASKQRLLDDWFSVEHQHSKGAWFLPEKASLKTGLANLPATFKSHPRFAHRITTEDWASVTLAKSSAGLMVWSILEPFFYELFLPLEIRASWSGLKTREDQLAAWETIDKFVTALGLGLDKQLRIFRYGAGWGGLSSGEQLKAKQDLLSNIAKQVTEEIGARYRAYCCRQLIANYYQKARDGRATRRRVLTRIADRKALVGFFGRILSERGNAFDRTKAVRLAAVFRIFGRETPSRRATLYGNPEGPVFCWCYQEPSCDCAREGSRCRGGGTRPFNLLGRPGAKERSGVSPVEERVQVLSEFWNAFDELHGLQAPGMPSLWGLVEEFRSIHIGPQGPDWYNPQLYRKLLPEALQHRIEELWGAMMLPQWPDRIVTEIAPHALMGETFGPALAFWHGCALTAWFVCEGPFSRTDIPGLSAYHARHLSALRDLATPVDEHLFEELNEAEGHLGPAVPIERSVSSTDLGNGVSVSMRVGMGSRRSGFEKLRNIITGYRRDWGRRYLASYLRGRWEQDLGEPARNYAQTIADTGKPPLQSDSLSKLLYRRIGGLAEISALSTRPLGKNVGTSHDAHPLCRQIGQGLAGRSSSPLVEHKSQEKLWSKAERKGRRKLLKSNGITI